MGGMCSYDKWIQILAWKSMPKSKKSLGRPRRKWEVNIKTHSSDIPYKL